MQDTTILAPLVRIVIALSTRTFFQPDEYFQSLEPAHFLVFGYGYLTWEWLSPQPIRSVIYPALNVPIYWLLKVTGLDSSWLLIAGPRVMHGAFAALTDIWVGKLARQILGDRYASTAVFLSLTSFFHVLALSRSLSNSLETSLTTIAISYYPWDYTGFTPQRLRRTVRRTLIFAAFACVIRPTNVVIWVYLFPVLLWRLRHHVAIIQGISVDAASIGILFLGLLFTLDSLYFQKPTLTPLNFLLVNMSSVSLFYGSSPWHYYISQGIPILCTTALPFVLHGFWLATVRKAGVPSLSILAGCVIWTTCVYSTAGHKEWRFLHPLLPMLHVLAAKSLVDLAQLKSTHSDGSPTRSTPTYTWSHRPPIRPSHMCALLLSIPASIYVSMLFCDGPIGAVEYLRRTPSSEELSHGSIGFLMPCHSTPWQAYMHRAELSDHGRLWALQCEPPLENQDLTSYKDQTDIFFESPIDYLRRHFPDAVNPTYPPSRFSRPYPALPEYENASLIQPEHHWDYEWPKYLVMFGALLQEPGVMELFEARGYIEVWKSVRDCGDCRRTGGVKIWKHGV